MKKCPYCFEELPGVVQRCLHCAQFIIDPIIEADYRSIDKKKCLFCGKKILAEAKVCRHCHKWLNEVDSAADNFDNIE